MEAFDQPSKTCWVLAPLFIISLCPAHPKRRLLWTHFEVQGMDVGRLIRASVSGRELIERELRR